MNLPSGIVQKLRERQLDGSLRELEVYDGIDFFSNDYLGLSQLKFDTSGNEGATGSRLISGNLLKTEELEEDLAHFYGHKAGLIFNSGFDANLGLFSAVPQKGDTIIYDALCHASIRDGIRLSQANSFSFRHNDIMHLNERLTAATGDIFVAVEAVYSMDGDQGNLEAIAKLCKKFGAYLIVDEAHSAGIFGAQGRGLVNELGLEDQVFAKLITFGKAYGSHGAIVVGSKELRTYLINFSRSFIYTTALPPASITRIAAVVEAVKQMDQERTKLKLNADYFTATVKETSVNCMPSASAIQSIMVRGNQAAKNKAAELKAAGFAVKAILYPTVPKQSERIRICLHSFNSQEDIKKLIHIFA
ncbi:aminotransferase class I/II-fold pyridoxal phosphate-dependent enzyme [Crocinitomix catalasitica]|uniref:aminotransferase class I/II-fold pyridoxal phosphate-dependent enzyme n=1 Tax=Crocinitomix catalasitica TaxID=184607 RepID=UPI000482B45C|nr:pyridoxal phosphate-dependent aminotransferase family protein [Crocinitomix catalasitica]